VKKFLILFVLIGIPPIFYVLYVSFAQNHYKKQPYYGARLDTFTALNRKGKPYVDTIYHQIADFVLTDQTGKKLSSTDSLRGRIYVAHFFYATPNGLSKSLIYQFGRVQTAFDDNPQVRLVSFTVNPTQDTLEALAAFAKKNGIVYPKWYLLTGQRSDIEKLATDSYLLTNTQSQGDGFFNNSQAVLIDDEGHIRGVYDGTSARPTDEMMGAIRALLIEYTNREPLLKPIKRLMQENK
jgi:protein SCO1/2